MRLSNTSPFLLALALACSPAIAGGPSSPQVKLPPGVYVGERDYRLAPAGVYDLDPEHTAIIAKVRHIGYSYSVFRFDAVTGSLTWDPAAPTRSQLKMSVRTASISTPVAGFAAELAGDGYLNAAAFPQATFISTAFRQTDATHGRVDGQFTLMGRTRPVTFDIDLIGAGKGFMGHPRIGAEARGTIDARDYGLPAVLGGPISLVIDAEFARAR